VANPAERNSVGGLGARGGGKPVRKRMPRKYRYYIPLAIRLMMLDDENRKQKRHYPHVARLHRELNRETDLFARLPYT
jgi:hypothetical protein